MPSSASTAILEMNECFKMYFCEIISQHFFITVIDALATTTEKTISANITGL